MDKSNKNTTQEEIIEKELEKASEKISKPGHLGEEARELEQLVVFELDKEEYAVNISEIREILRMPDVTPMPNTPDFIQGVINVRGKIVVVINLESRFNLERQTKENSLHVILTEIGDNTFGAVVDEVTEVLRVPKDSIEQAPAIISEKIQANYVKGIVVLENRLLIMLDFSKVFEEKGLVELGEIVKKQAKTAQIRRAEEKPAEKRETDAEHKAKIEELVEERIKGVKFASGTDLKEKADKKVKEEESKEVDEE